MRTNFINQLIEEARHNDKIFLFADFLVDDGVENDCHHA